MQNDFNLQKEQFRVEIETVLLDHLNGNPMNIVGIAPRHVKAEWMLDALCTKHQHSLFITAEITTDHMRNDTIRRIEFQLPRVNTMVNVGNVDALPLDAAATISSAMRLRKGLFLFVTNPMLVNVFRPDRVVRYGE